MSKRKSNKFVPLSEATINGDIEEVKRLINEGADINEQDRNFFTPLHYAAQFCEKENSFEIAKFLLEKGALTEIKDDYGNTPLSKAVFNSKGDGEMIYLLLSYGADRNNKNNYDVSPLDLAHTIANYPVAQFFED